MLYTVLPGLTLCMTLLNGSDSDPPTVNVAVDSDRLQGSFARTSYLDAAILLLQAAKQEKAKRSLGEKATDESILDENYEVLEPETISEEDLTPGLPDDSVRCPDRPIDCEEWLVECGFATSGVYRVWPRSRVDTSGDVGFDVYCDMDTDGGGWTVFQRRDDFERNSDFFYKNWLSYKFGFGLLDFDFWLGNDKIFALSNQRRSVLRIDLVDFGDEEGYATYDNFYIDDEKEGYRLHLGDYRGNAACCCKMLAPKRYFINKLCDFMGPPVNVPRDVVINRCLAYVQQIFNRQTVRSEDCDGGIYVGLAGVSYMCYYLAQHPAFSEHRQEFLVKSEEYLNPALSYANDPQGKSDRSNITAFLLGTCGTHAVASVVKKAIGKHEESNSFLKEYASVADMLIPVNFLRCGSDELFVGRAGYLSGVLFLQKTFNQQILPEEKIFALCEAIVKSGADYSGRVKSPCPLMYAYYGTEYLGAAHGLSAILQMLLSFPNYLDRNPEAEQKIKASVDFLLSLQSPSGNFPCAMDEVEQQRPESNELVHWCHGAPGVVYLLAKAFLRWKDSKYLNSCLLCGEVVWKKGLLKKGPGICHGVAGSGYVFLLLFRLTNDLKHLHRALQFADFLFDDEFKAARLPDRPLSLYEGLAGTVCFLADILQPDKAHFPFFDVF